MSSASSNQSFVCDGAGYEELYPSGYKEPDEAREVQFFGVQFFGEDFFEDKARETDVGEVG